MNILTLTPNISLYNFNRQTAGKSARFPNLAPLSHDSVSFTALKKSEFDGINLAAVEKFKAPIEKFHTSQDLQDWAEERVVEISEKDYGGRQQESQIQRNAMLKEWSDYVTKENNVYTPVMQLLILDAVTSGLKPNEDKLPPVLNKGVLADVMENMVKELDENPKQQFNLNKIYRTKLAAFYMDDLGSNSNSFTGWVEIPSKEHDEKNFEANVEKLKALSHKNWCTKSFNAEPYLHDGDFHVYLENGEPKLGVRFVGDNIKEIQGELNNNEIPRAYYDEVQRHINENNLKLWSKADSQVQDAKNLKMKFDKVKADLSDAIEKNDTKTILEYFGIECQELPDKMLSISHYKQPEDFTFDDLGIDENKIFEKIKIVENNIDIKDSKATNLSKLEKIGGMAMFVDSPNIDLSSLKEIGRSAKFLGSQITNLDKLEKIGMDASFQCSQITNLDNLTCINGHANFYNSQITSMKKLEKILGAANFCDTQNIDLSNLKEIGRSADFVYSQITNLDNLEKIGGSACFNNSQITSMKKLMQINYYAKFNNTPITDLGNLILINGEAIFDNSQIINLDKLKIINGKASFKNTPITNLDNLISINGDANFENSQITSLDNLISISGEAIFDNSQITNLKNLLKINNRISFKNTPITSLNKLYPQEEIYN